MGGIAVLARQAGHRVTGCDANVYPPMSTQLEQQGIELISGWDASQLAIAPDLWVIGNVVTRGNPLMEAILDRGLPYISGPQWLAENVLHQRWVLAVAGTHGKTTTTAMLTWILEATGRQPGFLIGGVPENFGVSARLGTAPSAGAPQPLFVIEADEYDTAFFDKRSKFVHYRPRTAILNNLEFDHADIFADLAAIETQFHHFVRTVPGTGRIVVQAGGRSPGGSADSALERVLRRGLWTPVERFGNLSTAANAGLTALNSPLNTANSTQRVDAPQGADWQASADGAGGSAGFEVLFQGVAQGWVQWSLMGEHNRHNALAAIAAARHVGVSPSEAIAALASFRNVKRRMELRGTVREIAVWDDFAHHPTAIQTTLEGLRTALPGRRVLAVLEPRSNTMKLGVMKAALSDSLRSADAVFCYTGGLGWDVAQALAPLADKLHCADDLDLLVAQIVASARPGDQLLVMSNGGFGGIHDKLLRALSVTPGAA